MTSFRIFLALMLLLLVGCTNNKNDMKLVNNNNFIRLFDVSGEIESAKVNGSVLNIIMGNDPNIHKFLVSGLDKDYYFSKGYKGVIDLSAAILATNLTSTTTLKIRCMDCKDLGKKTVELTVDFREVKSKLIGKDSEKIKIETPKKTTSVNLDEFKAQCKALGFKAGTQDFGNCVLQLNEGK